MPANSLSRRGACLGSPAVFGLCMALAAENGWAGDEPSENTYFEELPVVLSASRLPQTLADTPGAVTVINRELIRATGYRDIPRLLRLVPGFVVAQQDGHSALVTYHGLGSDLPNRMQVLIDGRSVYSPYFVGGVDWNALPITMDEVERIEVLRGSNSATYGSNAFLGVVNIVTRHSAEDRGDEAWAAAGSPRLGEAGFRHGGQIGNLSFRVNGQASGDRGFDKLHDGQINQTITFRADYQRLADEALTLWGGLRHERRGVGFSGTPANSNGERDNIGTSGFVHLRWQRQLGAGSEVSVGYYRNIDQMRDEWSAYLPPLFPVVPVDYDRRSIRDDAYLQHIYTVSTRLRMVWGAEIRQDRLESARLFYFSHVESAGLFRLYSNIEWRPYDALTVNAGAMVERYTGKSANLAPRAFANWHLAPDHTLRLGVSRAYRAPSLYEERGDLRFYSADTLLQQRFVSSGILLPERIDATEIGYVGRIAHSSTFLDVRLYRERIADFIDWRVLESALVPAPLVTPDTMQFFNAGGLEIHGLDAQLRAQPSPRMQLILSVAHTVIDATQRYFAHSAPRNSWSLTWLQNYPGNLSSTATLYRVDPYTFSVGTPPVARYTSYDLRLSHKTLLFGRPAEIAAVLLDCGAPHNEYAYDGQPIAGIVSHQAYVTMRIEF
jgi:iron complex outermembrane receptor protein